SDKATKCATRILIAGPHLRDAQWCLGGNFCINEDALLLPRLGTPVTGFIPSHVITHFCLPALKSSNSAHAAGLMLRTSVTLKQFVSLNRIKACSRCQGRRWGTRRLPPSGRPP